jgi:tRNA pseudouridine38-40 synthase
MAMQRATLSLVGRHDFTAFALAGGGHRQPFRRVLSAEWKRSGKELQLQIVGDGFLRGMVRSIVGTLLEVGRSRMTIPEFESLLQGRSREEAGPTAPAHGLVLQRVHYAEEWGLEEAISGADDVLD